MNCIGSVPTAKLYGNKWPYYNVKFDCAALSSIDAFVDRKLIKFFARGSRAWRDIRCQWIHRFVGLAKNLSAAFPASGGL